ncbi:MAG TPA: hypothetical protein VFD70_25590 [Anaerolineae bacterium]|nr:hypothetical protein [Anaerolineae bacterium]
MDSRNVVMGEFLLVALGIASLVALSVALVLYLGGAFSWMWYAHAILTIGVLTCLFEIVILQRVLRRKPVVGALTKWRRIDRTREYSLALLVGLLALALLACGGMMEVLAER